MNKVILIGNLGADAQARQTQTGTYVLNVRLATNERRKVSEEWQDHTEWHDVVIFGKRAEGLAKFLYKGMKIGVEGRLQTDTWEDQQTGVKRWRTQVIADDIELLSSRDQQQAPLAPPPRRQLFAQRPQGQPPLAPRGWAPQGNQQPPPPAQQPQRAAAPPPEQDPWALQGPPGGDDAPDYDPFGNFGGQP